MRDDSLVDTVGPYKVFSRRHDGQRARESRHDLVFGRSVRIGTMMQSCASAAKLRAAGPICTAACAHFETNTGRSGRIFRVNATRSFKSKVTKAKTFRETCYTRPMKTFSDKVRDIVRKIPKGKTMTYKAVAAKAGNPKAARAVGAIMRTNYDPSIPCHRVIASDGSMRGYVRPRRRPAQQ